MSGTGTMNAEEEAKAVGDDPIRFLQREVDAPKIVLLAVLENAVREAGADYSAAFSVHLIQETERNVKKIMSECYKENAEGLQNIVKKIKEVSENIQTLYEFFSLIARLIRMDASAPNLPNHTQLNPSSILGDFARQMAIGFFASSFSRQSVLCGDLRQIARVDWLTYLSTNRSNRVDYPTSFTSTSLQSLEVASYLAENQIKDKYGRVPMVEIKELVTRFPKSNNPCIQSLQTRIGVAMKAQDWSKALSTLYIYLEQTETTEDANSRMKSHFPEYLLQLAALHLHFNHIHETIQALNECVVLAQQSMNKVCLSKALLYLAKVAGLTNQPGPQEYYLKHCQVVAKSIENNELYHMATLALVLFYLENGVKSQAEVTMSPFGETEKLETILSEMQQLTHSTSAHLNLLTSITSATHWENLGLYDLAYLDVSASRGYLMEEWDAECFEIIYSKLVTLSALNGDWVAAVDHLADANEKAPYAKLPVIRKARLSVLFEWSVLRNDLEVAKHAVRHLESISLPESNQAKQKIEIMIMKARLECLSGNFDAAFKIASKALSDTEKNHLMHTKIDALICICDLYQRAGNPMSGVNIILEALSLSEQLIAKPAELICIYKLAEIRFQMGDLNASKTIFDEYGSILFERLPFVFKTTASLLNAKLMMLSANTRDDLSHAIEELELCAEGFQKIQFVRRVGETHDLLSSTYRKLKENEKAAECDSIIGLLLSKSMEWSESSLEEKYDILKNWCGIHKVHAGDDSLQSTE